MKNIFSIFSREEKHLKTHAQVVRDYLIGEGLWPECVYSKPVKKYVLDISMEELARKMVDHGVEKDEEFLSMFKEHMSKVSVSISINNMKLEKSWKFLQETFEKYSQ
jgi:hypothetical protein